MQMNKAATEDYYEIDPQVFIDGNAGYCTFPFPEPYEAGILINADIANYVETLFTSPYIEAVQVAFVAGGKTVIITVVEGSLKDWVATFDEPNEMYHFTPEKLKESKAPYMLLDGSLASGEHLYAVMAEYLRGFQLKDVPDVAAGMPVEHISPSQFDHFKRCLETETGTGGFSA